MPAQMNIGVPFDYQPIQSHRFLAEFASELGIESWLVQEFTGPELKIGKKEITYLNGKTYVSGIGEWSEITIKFLNIIGPSTGSKLMEMVRLTHESITGRQGYAAGYLKDITLKPLDPTGIEVQKWVLEKCMVVSIKQDDFKMGSDDVNMFTVVVQPQKCILSY